MPLETALTQISKITSPFIPEVFMKLSTSSRSRPRQTLDWVGKSNKSRDEDLPLSEYFVQYWPQPIKGIYDPLDANLREIRLLILLPTENEDTPIHLSMFTTRLRGSEYRAISYVWGATEQQHSIFVNGQRLQISPCT